MNWWQLMWGEGLSAWIEGGVNEEECWRVNWRESEEWRHRLKIIFLILSTATARAESPQQQEPNVVEL